MPCLAFSETSLERSYDTGSAMVAVRLYTPTVSSSRQIREHLDSRPKVAGRAPKASCLDLASPDTRSRPSDCTLEGM